MLIASLAAALSGCGGNQEGNDRLTEVPAATIYTYRIMTHYSNAAEKLPVDASIAEVHKQFPNVTLIPEPLANDNGEQFKTRLVTGDLPAIMDINGQTIENVITSGSVIRLYSYFNAHPDYANQLIPSVADNLRYSDGHIYAFPRNGPAADLLYYNKRLFETYNIEVPTHYAQLLTAVKVLRSHNIIPIAMFAKQAWPVGAFFDMFAMRANRDGMMALSQGTAKASDPGYKEAIRKMGELIQNGVFQQNAIATDYVSAKALFYSGKAAMFISGEWDISDTEAHLGKDVDFMDVFPTTDQGAVQANPLAMPGGGEPGGIAVAANAPNTDLAVQVAAAYTRAFQIYSFELQSSTMVTIPTEGLTPEHPLSEMTKRLLLSKSHYVMRSMPEHSLPNKKFAAAFGEELQKFAAGELPDDFIRNTDSLILSTR